MEMHGQMPIAMWQIPKSEHMLDLLQLAQFAGCETSLLKNLVLCWPHLDHYLVDSAINSSFIQPVPGV